MSENRVVPHSRYLKSIRQAVYLPGALARYNRIYGTRVSFSHIRVLFLLRESVVPQNRKSLLRLLAALGITMNYSQINRALDRLHLSGFIQIRFQSGPTLYQIDIEGTLLLSWLENKMRKIRLDKLSTKAITGVWE